MQHHSKQLTLIFIFLVGFLVLANSAFAFENNRALPFWVWIQTAVGPSLSTSEIDVAVDSRTHVHGLMSDSGTRYARLTSTWVNKVKLHEVDAHERAIQVDSADLPHLAYAVPMPLTYASLTPGGWITESTGYYVEQLADIELLSDGSVYMAYEIDELFYLMVKSEGQWEQLEVPFDCTNTNPVVTHFDTGFDFAVSDDGDVHLAYGCNEQESFYSNEVHYVSFVNAVWSHTRLKPSSIANLVGYRGLSLALDNQDEPHILIGTTTYDSELGGNRAFAKLLRWTTTNGIEVVTSYSEGSSDGKYTELVPYESSFDITGALNATYTTSSSSSQAIRDGHLNYLRKNSDGLLLNGLDDFYENEFTETYDTFSDHNLFIDNNARPAVAMSSVKDNWRISPIARIKLSYIPNELQGESIFKAFLPIVHGSP